MAKTTPMERTPANARALVDLYDQATEENAYLIGRQAYIWGWPAVNLYNRREKLRSVPMPGVNCGIPVAPINQIAVLTDYMAAGQRLVVCPNQDVVYGQGFADLSISAIVLQIPDFGTRFWVMNLMDAYTDVVSAPGSRSGTKPGFYLLVGPKWKGEVPVGITSVIRSPTELVWYVARAFMHDTPEDRAAIRPIMNQLNVYPQSRFTGKVRETDWSKVPVYQPVITVGSEIRWVREEQFWDDLVKVIKANEPRPGEESWVRSVKLIVDRRQESKAIQRGLERAATDGSKLVDSGFAFSIQPDKFGHHWAGDLTGGVFGSDYLRRAWVARAYIGVNKPEDALYIGTDLDFRGARLSGEKRYSITFPKGSQPPVKGFWSISAYDADHFFEPNPLNRHSLGTKTTDLKPNPDGSLTLYIQKDLPSKQCVPNWLPCPAGKFSLLLRMFGPEDSVLQRKYAPPPVVELDRE